MMYSECWTKVGILGSFAFLVGCMKGVASSAGTEGSDVSFNAIPAGMTPR